MKNQTKQIEKFCQEKGISLVQSKFENQSSTFYVDWDDELSKFLEFADKSNCKILFRDELKVQFEHHKSEVEEANISDRDLLEDANEILNELKKLKNKIIKFSILASVNGTNIFYSEYSDHAEEFFELTERLDNIIELGKEEVMSEPTLRYHERRKLMEPFAIELATSKDYYRTLISDDEQNALMDKVLGDRPYHLEGYDKDKDPMTEFLLRYDIRKLAKAHFKIHVEPELEKEFIEKIREWKKTKTPKIEMASKLGITMDKLNSYYYKA